MFEFGSNGQQALMRPLRAAPLRAILVLHAPASGILFLACGVSALVEDVVPFAISCLAIAAACGVAFFAGWRPAAFTRASRIEVLVGLVLAFTLVSALAAVPFMALGMSLTDAVFEATSGVTSTGLTIFGDVERLPFSALLLRALLQWFGAGLFLLSALALVLGPGPVARRLGSTEFDDHRLMESSVARARIVMTVYLIATVLTVTALMLLSGSPRDGLLIGLTAVSTGGFSGTNDSLGAYGALFSAVALFAGLATAISLAAYGRLTKQGVATFFSAPEVIAIVLLTALAALAIASFEAQNAGWTLANAGHSLATAVSAQSTAGFSTTSTAGYTPESQIVLIITMMIGGDVGSTAGGLKIVRILILAAIVWLVLTRIALPSRAVVSSKIGERAIRPDDVNGAIAILVLYLLAQVIGWLIFTASGAPAIPALFEVTSALSTVGLSAGLTGPDMAAHLKWCLVVLMIAGRVELIGVLILLMPQTWSAPRQ
jgi:trk system potassium uptake protein TrkH